MESDANAEIAPVMMINSIFRIGTSRVVFVSYCHDAHPSKDVCRRLGCNDDFSLEIRIERPKI